LERKDVSILPASDQEENYYQGGMSERNEKQTQSLQAILSDRGPREGKRIKVSIEVSQQEGKFFFYRLREGNADSE